MIEQQLVLIVHIQILVNIVDTATSSSSCALTIEIDGTDISNSPFTVSVSQGTIDVIIVGYVDF